MPISLVNRRAAPLLFVIALLAGACGGGDTQAVSSGDPQEAAEVTTATPEPLPTADPTATPEPPPTPTEVPPVTPALAVERAWEEVAGGEECGCSDGSDWSFWVREADPAKVVLYFQGGGACFNATSCSVTDGTYKVTGGPEDDPTGAPGIFDFDNPDNPFADWSFVFVPYCTGDVHIGANVQDYGDGLVVDHNGFANASRALDELLARFSDAGEVFVTGSSAGGVPAPLFAGLVSDELPDARVVALADGSGGYADVPAVNAAIGALWGTFANVPDWPVSAELTPVDWSIPGLFVQAGLHDPDIVFARHDHAFDGVQESFASAAGTLQADLLTLIDGIATDIEAAGVDVATYVAPGTDHTILGRPELYTQEVGGVRLVEWVAALAAGEDVDDVHCEECGGGS